MSQVLRVPVLFALAPDLDALAPEVVVARGVVAPLPGAAVGPRFLTTSQRFAVWILNVSPPRRRVGAFTSVTSRTAICP